MDKYVNEVGTRIGQLVWSQGGDTAEVFHLVSKVMQNSFPAKSWQGNKWIKIPDAGYKMVGSVPTELPNGVVLPPVVVAETNTKVWEGSNPEAFPGTPIPTGATNVPDRSWISPFNYAGATPTKALKYMLKNRPAGPPDPVIPREATYP